MSLVTEEIKASASEMYQGNEKCQEKSKFLLTEMGLPNGLLPMEDMVECGYVKDTGFVWLKQKKKCEHKFDKIGNLFPMRMKSLLLLRKARSRTDRGQDQGAADVDHTERYLRRRSATGKITFKTPTGLFRTLPVSAFQIEVKDAKEGVNGDKEVEAKEI